MTTSSNGARRISLSCVVSLPYHHGIPCSDWLRCLMNRLDPDLFRDCFTAWAMELRPDAESLIAIDGKTARRSHDHGAGRRALHLVSAFATNEKLVLCQEAVDDKSNELTAIPNLVDRLAASGALNGAIISIDAIACNAKIATKIIESGANYLLAVKANQPTLEAEISAYFDTAPKTKINTNSDVDKDHGRIETRHVRVSQEVDWLVSERRHPGEYRFPALATLIMVEAEVVKAGRTSTERRLYISSARLSAAQAAATVRGHWAIENSLHWVLDVVFREDQSRLRKGHGAENMAIVRHFAINIVRSANDQKSIKTRRKRAGWDLDYLATLLSTSAR